MNLKDLCNSVGLHLYSPELTSYPTIIPLATLSPLPRETRTHSQLPGMLVWAFLVGNIPQQCEGPRSHLTTSFSCLAHHCEALI